MTRCCHKTMHYLGGIHTVLCFPSKVCKLHGNCFKNNISAECLHLPVAGNKNVISTKFCHIVLILPIFFAVSVYMYNICNLHYASNIQAPDTFTTRNNKSNTLQFLAWSPNEKRYICIFNVGIICWKTDKIVFHNILLSDQLIPQALQ